MQGGTAAWQNVGLVPASSEVAGRAAPLSTLKAIFHWKLGSRWLPNTNEINTKTMKCTGPTPEFCVGTKRNLYSIGLRLGFASGKTQILGFVLAPRYQHVCIPNAKFWRRGYCPTPTPNARYFASQWNIGLKNTH